VRARDRATMVLLVSSGIGAPAVACVDLFHSTADLLTACELDATADGCAPPARDAAPVPGDGAADAGVGAGPTDFCAWSSSEARQHAARACAWLGACETPLGRNAFGPCMFEALLAFDCAANPNHRATGQRRRLWDCLWQVRSCADVEACIVPAAVCSRSTASAGCDGTTRFECTDAGVRAENCALWGKTCTVDLTGTSCTGGGGALCDSGLGGCDGPSLSRLHWCAADGEDLGIDCSGNGAGRCAAFDAVDASWVACVAGSDAGPCAPTAAATCTDSGVAASCPSGNPETLDCTALLGGDATTCNAGPLAPPFDWTSPCAVMQSPCTADSCDGSVLTGCARGATFTVDCGDHVLGTGGTCRTTAAEPGATTHAMCVAR